MALMMKCGHVASAKCVLEDGSMIPCCAICKGFKESAEEVERECIGTDGLEGRKARCAYTSPHPGNKCGGEVASSWELPFFEHRPSEPYDKYYCGCWGWD